LIALPHLPGLPESSNKPRVQKLRDPEEVA
jgi:hypothetical protein